MKKIEKLINKRMKKNRFKRILTSWYDTPEKNKELDLLFKEEMKWKEK